MCVPLPSPAGLNFLIIKLYPMRPGATMMSSFIVNTALILVMSPAIVQFCAQVRTCAPCTRYWDGEAVRTSVPYACGRVHGYQMRGSALAPWQGCLPGRKQLSGYRHPVRPKMLSAFLPQILPYVHLAPCLTQSPTPYRSGLPGGRVRLLSMVCSYHGADTTLISHPPGLRGVCADCTGSFDPETIICRTINH